MGQLGQRSNRRVSGLDVIISDNAAMTEHPKHVFASLDLAWIDALLSSHVLSSLVSYHLIRCILHDRVKFGLLSYQLYAVLFPVSKPSSQDLGGKGRIEVIHR